MLTAPTMTPPLAPYSWPPIFWQANLRRQPKFVHLSTRVTQRGNAHRPCCGSTLWGRVSDDGHAGLAWDWVEICAGVVAMRDPMAVATNLQLVSESGELLQPTAAVLHFNQFVRRLPWQDEVRRMLQVA